MRGNKIILPEIVTIHKLPSPLAKIRKIGRQIHQYSPGPYRLVAEPAAGMHNLKSTNDIYKAMFNHQPENCKRHCRSWGHHAGIIPWCFFSGWTVIPAKAVLVHGWKRIVIKPFARLPSEIKRHQIHLKEGDYDIPEPAEETSDRRDTVSGNWNKTGNFTTSRWLTAW